MFFNVNFKIQRHFLLFKIENVKFLYEKATDVGVNLKTGVSVP